MLIEALAELLVLIVVGVLTVSENVAVALVLVVRVVPENVSASLVAPAHDEVLALVASIVPCSDAFLAPCIDAFLESNWLVIASPCNAKLPSARGSVTFDSQFLCTVS